MALDRKLSSNGSEDDPWKLPELEETGLSWSELDTKGKIQRVVVQWILRTLAILACLYMFIIALDILGSAFKILGGPTSGKAFRESDIMNNPIAGLMLGVLATVLVQSSSTSTSVVVSMVASEILTVKQAIPIVMGANVGTSVTSTLVALAHVGNKDEFRRAFGAATIHDMFNILSVCVLLPIEVITGFLRRLTDAIVESSGLEGKGSGKKVDILKKITKPVTAAIVSVDKNLPKKIANAENSEELDKLLKKRMVKTSTEGHWFTNTSMSDVGVGLLLLFISLVLLTLCLLLLVKLLHSAMRGRLAVVLRQTINLELPGRWSVLSGYILMALGVGMTIVVQSSSITTSTVTPLVGIGVLTLDKVCPIVLGANIGTTCTALLAALAGSNVALALQIALCHLFFNVTGILVWYPWPALRKIPIAGAKALGNYTCTHRWFAPTYIAVVFVAIPGVLFGLSLAGWKVFVGVFIPIVFILGLLLTLIVLRANKPDVLPDSLRGNPGWLPQVFHVAEQGSQGGPPVVVIPSEGGNNEDNDNDENGGDGTNDDDAPKNRDGVEDTQLTEADADPVNPLAPPTL